MVNSHGIYLLLEDRYLLLCHSRFGTVPNGMSLEQWDSLPSLLETAQPVQVENGMLRFPAAVFRLQLRSVPVDTQLLLPSREGLQAGIRILAANAKPTGLSSPVFPLFEGQTLPMNPYCQMALPYVQQLLRSLQKENMSGIEEAVSAILGLGPGLTPSGDDLLSGLLYGLRHSPARDTAVCEMLGNAIRRNAGERTNAVSADYLMAIAGDAAFDFMAAAWADPSTGAARLMQIGSNSGGEMLLGLLIAAAIQIEVL
jgi:hypothetical protein